MPSKWISHFSGGVFGKYLGHSVQNDGGEIDHFKYDGSIVPGEKYVGHSKVEKPTGGGGVEIPGSGFLLIILAPFLLLLGLIALSALVYLGPLYGLFLMIFRERSVGADDNERASFVGVGWVILAFFILVIGLIWLALVSGLSRLFIATPIWVFSSGGNTGVLIQFWMTVAWVVTSVLFAIGILIKNPKSVVIGVFAFLGGFCAFGHFVVDKNLARTRHQFPITSNPASLPSGTAGTEGSGGRGDQSMQAPRISGVSDVLPRQLQTITIQGSGFGAQPAYAGDSKFIRVTNLTSDWNAGSSRDYPPDGITLSIDSWTDSQIVLTGFGGAYGGGQYLLHPGDDIRFEVWNPLTGLGPEIHRVFVAVDTAPN